MGININMEAQMQTDFQSVTKSQVSLHQEMDPRYKNRKKAKISSIKMDAANIESKMSHKSVFKPKKIYLNSKLKEFEAPFMPQNTKAASRYLVTETSKDTSDLVIYNTG